MDRKHRRAKALIWTAVLWAVISCGGCGPKYEPVSLDKGTQAAPKGDASQTKEEKEKKETAPEQEEKDRAAEERETKNDATKPESTAVAESGETESSESEEVPSSEEAAETLSPDDMFYQQCGMSREEAEHGRISFIEDVMNDSRDAVAARISYPRTVTVASGSYQVQDAVSFLAYYDEIFTDAFKMELDRQAEQELFCSDGMISFGDGLVWFFPSDSGTSMGIGTINGLDGCSVRYGQE